MKKLLFLINTFDGGGAELVLTNTANALSEKYDVTVMTVSGGGVHENRLCANVRYKSIIRCKNAFLRRAFTYLINFVLPPVIVHKLFIGNGYDYEIAFLEGVPTKIIGAAKTKKYAWVHTDLMKIDGLEKVYRDFDRCILCYKTFDKIICVSEACKESFLECFGYFENVEVKYNILDDEVIREKAREVLAPKNRFRIVSVGRLEKVKGFDRLIEIAGRLYSEKIDFELVLVGNGSEYDSLKKQATELGIADRVEFTGFVDNPYKYMKSADLLVFPSRVEGYSTVVTEAIILGKPVITSDCSGMNEILGDSEYGIVTDSDEALYGAIKNMISDKNLRESYAKRAQERAKDFSLQARVSELEELF